MRGGAEVGLGMADKIGGEVKFGSLPGADVDCVLPIELELLLSSLIACTMLLSVFVFVAVFSCLSFVTLLLFRQFVIGREILAAKIE